MSGQTGAAYFTANPFEIDANGVPLAGAQLFFFEFGTVTPFDTWSDPGLTTPNANPIIADANGRFGSVWLSPSQAYTVQLWTAPTDDNPTGSQIWSRGPFGPAAGGVPANSVGIIGEVRVFAGPAASIPGLWYACFGQAVSRATYAALFAVIGTTWGAGDTSTTFNLPDLRGRGMFGVDNMGGSPANRITSGVSGVSGVTLGATGGDQATQEHTHTLSDPGHLHAITDPGHSHVEQVGQPTGSGSVNGWNVVPSTALVSAVIATQTSTTGISTQDAQTGVAVANYGAGEAQNLPPAAMVNMIIYAGA